MLFGSKKKKQEKLDKEHQGFDDILDLDNDLDELGLGESTGREKIDQFNSGFRRGFSNDMNRRNALNGLMAGALPDEYAHLYSAGMNAQRIIREDVKQAREQNAEVLLSMVERTERHLPKLKRFAPKRVYSRFEENLARSRKSLINEVETKYRRIRGTQSNDGDEEAIKDALLDITAYNDARETTRDQERYLKESAQRTLQAEVERTRFGTTTEQLGQIAGNLERQSAFQDSITYRFQRKSLEVQYRSLFMLRDLRKLSGANLDLQRRGFEALVHNSSLTNAQRATQAIHSFKNSHLDQLAKEAGVTEAPAFYYGNAIRTGLTLGATTSAREKLPGFLASYGPTIRENILKGVADLLQTADTTAEMAEMARETSSGLSGADRAAVGGQGVGGKLGRLFGDYVAPRMGRFARPAIDKANGRLGGRGHLASYWVNNLPSILQDFSRNYSSEDSGLMGMLRNGVKALTPTYYREDELEDGSYQTIDREVGFNHLSQRSIVEIIPGYLSRLLHETRMMRTGDTSIDREVYDVTKGRFTTIKGAREALRDRLVPETQRTNVATTLDSIMTTYMGDDTLSDEAKFALREQLMQDAGSGGRFDPVKYARGEFAPDTPDSTTQELSAFFKRQFDFDDDGKLVKEYDNLRRLDEYAREFSLLRDVMPDPRDEISRLHSAGSQELMRDLGLVYSSAGRDYTDFKQVWKMYRGDDEDWEGEGGIAPNTSAQPGRQSPYRSHDQGNVDGDGASTDKLNDVGVGEASSTKTPRWKQHLENARRKAKAAEASPDVTEKTGATKPPRNARKSTPHPSDALNRSKSGEGFQAFYRDAKQRTADLFTREGKRTLLKRDLVAGLYIDKQSQKVIYDIKDIKGEVVDRDGNVILTEEEFRDGLYNVENVQVKSKSRLGSLLGRDPSKSGRMDGAKETLSNLRDRAKEANRVRRNIGSLLGGYFTTDAYLPGEETPRIRVAAMRDGEYTNRKGTVIRRISDIRGTVFDRNLNVVVSEDELKQLVNIKGESHAIANNTRGLGRLLSKGTQGAGKYLDWTKNYYKKLPGRLWRGAKAIRHPIRTTLGMDEETPTILEGVGKRAGQMYNKTRHMFDIGMNDGRNIDPIKERDKDWINDDDAPVDDDAIRTPTDGLLNRINDTLERAYPDPHRKGSWQQILADRKAKREAEAKAARAEGKEEKPLVNVFDQMKDMFGGLKDILGKGAGGLLGMLGLDGGAAVLGNPMGGGGDGGSGRDKPKKGGWFKRGAKAVGKWGWLGLGFLGKGALAAGSATVATVGLPVILGTAAVAGVVGGGIYLWNRKQETAGKLYRWRFAQYGFDPEERDQAVPILALEKHVEEITVRNGPNDITVDLSRMDMDQVKELFRINETSQERIDEFRQWFNGRFLPVYMAHQRALVTMSPAVKLTEVDSELDKADGYGFIEAVVVPPGALSITASPFGPDQPITATPQVIDDYLSEAKAYYDVSREARNARRRSAGPGQGFREEQRAQRYAENEPTSTTRAQRRQQLNRSGSPEVSAGAIEAARSVADHMAFRSKLADLFKPKVASPLQSMRLHGYGLDHTDSMMVDVAFTLETRVFEYIGINRDNQAVFTGNPNTHLEEISDLLGFAWRPDHEDAQKWRYWFMSRFLPVVLAYVGKMHHVSPGSALGGSGSVLSKEQRLSVARAIMGAQTVQDGQSVPVWDIIIDVFPGNDIGIAEQKAREVLRLIEEDAHKTSTTPRITPETALKRQQDRREMERRVTQGAGNTPAQTDHWNAYMADRESMASGALGTQGNTSPLPPGGVSGPRGNVYGGFGEGNGGAWESLPLPSKDADRAAAMPTLEGVEEMTGVDANLLATFAKIESNFRSQVKASTSSATGWFQFLNATWDEMIEKHGAKYGIPTNLPEDQRREMRKDPRINALMGAEFLKGNHAYLSRHINREPTDADLYLAHFLGMGGAKKLLTADTNTRADRLFEDPAKSNPTVFYHGGDRSRPRTIGDMIAWADSKVAPGRVAGGGSNVFSPTTPDSQLTPQVDVSGVTAMNDRQVVQVGPDGAEGAYQFADQSTAAAEVSEHLNQANQGRRTVPGVDPSGSVALSAGRSATSPSFPTVEEDVADITQTQQQRRTQVMETERRQRERLEESVVETQAMGSIAQQQLETQREMRDYLLKIAESFGIIEKDGMKIRQDDEASKPSNDSSNPPTTTTSGQRRTGNTPAPVSMSFN